MACKPLHRVGSVVERYLLLGFLFAFFCAAFVALTVFPSAAQAHFECSLDPREPWLSGSYPNQSATATGVVYCDAEYSGDIRLRGWTGSSWNVMVLNTIWCPPGCGAHQFWSDPKPCLSYNYVDTFMYANFGGHGHTNDGPSAACNFP